MASISVTSKVYPATTVRASVETLTSNGQTIHKTIPGYTQATPQTTTMTHYFPAAKVKRAPDKNYEERNLPYGIVKSPATYTFAYPASTWPAGPFTATLHGKPVTGSRSAGSFPGATFTQTVTSGEYILTAKKRAPSLVMSVVASPFTLTITDPATTVPATTVIHTVDGTTTESFVSAVQTRPVETHFFIVSQGETVYKEVNKRVATSSVVEGTAAGPNDAKRTAAPEPESCDESKFEDKAVNETVADAVKAPLNSILKNGTHDWHHHHGKYMDENVEVFNISASAVATVTNTITYTVSGTATTATETWTIEEFKRSMTAAAAI